MMFGFIYRMFSGRSPQWPSVRSAHLRMYPRCEACVAGDDLEVHHLDPVSWRPDKELDPENLMTLCRRCHLLIGHLDDWKSFNPNAEEDAVAWREKIKERPVNPYPYGF